MRKASLPVAVLVLAAAATLFVLRPLSLTMPAPGLDSSWITVLGEAATLPARWGVDIAFTYGPASALVTRYDTDGYLATGLPILLAVALISGLCFARLVGLSVAGRRSAAGLAVLAVAAECFGLAGALAQDQDGFVFAFALGLFLLDIVRRPGDRASLAAVLGGGAALGVLALSKTSYGIVALVFCLLADARATLVRRRLPLLTPLFVAAFLATFVAYGQHLADLPAFFRLQGEEAAGYGEAMYLVGNRFELVAYIGAAAALTGIAALAGAPGGNGRLFTAFGTAFILAIGLKAGFVRADTHTQIAWSLLGLAGLAVAVALVMPRSALGAGLLGAASLAVLWVVAPLFLLAATDRPPVPSRLSEIYRDMAGGLAVETDAWVRVLRDPQRFASDARSAKAEAWDSVRARQPLPRLVGGVDILPSEQSAVLANGLEYRHRPSFQEYSTYTAGLIAANSAFYAGPEAPDWVLFGAGGLDDRYPTATEGALWPDLLQRYEPTRRAGAWLALHRRATPLPDVLGPPRTVATRLGHPVALNEAGPVFARIAVGKTLLGRFAATLFRPPSLTLRIAMADGREQNYRFIPALGAAGFLLSPLASGADAFAELGFGNTDDLGGQVVTEVTVGGSPSAALFYDRSVSIALQRVIVPPMPPTPEARALFDELARERPWRRSVIAIGRAKDLDGDRLSANAPTSFVLPVKDSRHLQIGFGIDDGAWMEGKTEGVCFSVTTPSSAATPLWRRCLDPRTVPADRGPQTAAIDLPPGITAVTAQTTCPKSCDWGWSYWDDITPER